MIRSFTGGTYDNEQEGTSTGSDSTSVGLHENTMVQADDFRSLTNCNSRASCEITAEPVREINEELNSQKSRKLEEIRSELSPPIPSNKLLRY